VEAFFVLFTDRHQRPVSEEVDGEVSYGPLFYKNVPAWALFYEDSCVGAPSEEGGDCLRGVTVVLVDSTTGEDIVRYSGDKELARFP